MDVTEITDVLDITDVMDITNVRDIMDVTGVRDIIIPEILEPKRDQHTPLIMLHADSSAVLALYETRKCLSYLAHPLHIVLSYCYIYILHCVGHNVTNLFFLPYFFVG